MAINPDELSQRVAKLLSLSTSSNPHEAALAAAKAQELIQKYNLDLASIRANAATERERNPNITSEELTLGIQMHHGWQRTLIHVVASNTFCKSIHITRTNRVVVFGEKHNITTTRYLYSYLSKTIYDMGTKAWGEHQRSYGHKPSDMQNRYTKEWRNPWIFAYCRGACITINERLAAQHQQAQAANADMRALVLVTTTALQRAAEAEFTTIKKGNLRQLKREGGFQQGREDAKHIALNKPIEQPAKPAWQLNARTARTSR